MEPVNAEVTAYIGRWRPSSVSPRAAAFARDVITAAGPEGRERAKNLDPDILCADAARYYSIYGVYGISVFAGPR